MNYEHAENQLQATRVATPYHVPVSVAPHLDFIAPTLRFPAPMRALVRKTDKAGPNDLYNTPNILHELYQVPTDVTGVMSVAAASA